MNRKAISFGIAGIFIMLSYFIVMMGVQLWMDSMPFNIHLMTGLISAGIGFALLGYVLDFERTR